ncbi:MAG: DivIVA domain-containing protein [Propionibacteriales bacterium]|nr:DivIVA domain-containing protein [Propionibacteriales bacterium]
MLIMVLTAVGVVIAMRGGTGMRRVYDDRPDVLLPADRPLTGQDLREVRFGVGLRGYRMDEVDALIARLAAELESAADREPE